MRVIPCLTALFISFFAIAANAGPWPRAEKTVFLSSSFERDRESNDYASLYAEYGLSSRTTFGAELGHSSAEETTGLVWLQRALDAGQGADRWSISLGAGVLRRGDSTIPLAQIGASWGRGLSELPVLNRLPGGGWLAVDTRLRIAGERRDDADIVTRVENGDGILAYVTPKATAKADVTLGWNVKERTILISQLRLEDRADIGFSSKIAGSVVRDLGPVRVEVGMILPVSGIGEPALKLGGWFQF